MSILIMILLISILVLVHEAGHFIAARMCGIRVTRFGIGMPLGPSWKMFRWGKTDFYIHACLFGGYVGFADDEESFRKEEKNKEIDEEEILPSDSPELYENKTIAQKFFVISAGVLMNIIFAFFLVVLCASIFHKLPTNEQILYVDNFASKVTSNIEAKGAKKGDRILKVNSVDIKSMYQLSLFAKNSKLFDDYAQNDLVERNLEQLKKLNPQAEDNLSIGQEIKLPKTLIEEPLRLSDDVLKGFERYKKQGVQLNQTQIELRNEIYSKDKYVLKNETTLEDIAIALSDTYKPLIVTLKRNDKEIVLNDIKVDESGVFGIILKIEEVYNETKTVKDIFVKSYEYISYTTYTMLKGLWQLFSGKVSMSDMHGVIAVVKIGADVIAAKGILNGLLLTAMISINLAIMNFLPIPALDGGHAMFLMIEKITGKKPSKEMGEKINNFFFMLLILLMVVICYNDIFALITKKF